MRTLLQKGSLGWFVELGFEPRDLRVGLKWRLRQLDFLPGRRELFVQLCLLPMFPIHITIRVKNRPQLIAMGTGPWRIQ